jgi:hypothetical protein
MKKRITSHLIVLILVLHTAAFRGCSPEQQSKADRFILAVEAARTLPAAFGVTGERAQIVSDGFGAVAAAARAYKDGSGTWDALVATFNDVRARPSWQKLDGDLKSRVEAVWAVAAVLLESVRPAAGSMDGQGAEPDFGRVEEAQLRKLEQLVGRRK